jgi:hypothetical protein
MNAGRNSSPAARMALQLARGEYREAETLALAVPGARVALALVKAHTAGASEVTVA